MTDCFTVTEMKTYNREEWTTLVVFLQVGTIQVLGKPWAPGCDSLGFDGTTSTLGQQRARRGLLEEGAARQVGDPWLEINKRFCQFYRQKI